MLECVPNVAEGRRAAVIDALAAACGDALLDVHSDPDHHRSVFTLAGPATEDGVRHLARAVAERVDLTRHEGVHPRMGALDVVPFVGASAVEAARSFATWVSEELGIPSVLYGDADPAARSLPTVRRTLVEPHPRLGVVAVGARQSLVAVNCDLDRDDLALARHTARAVRERDGGLPGVRALAFRLASRRLAQVSMNVTRLGECSVERACTEVRRLAEEAGADVEVELVGLVPEAEYNRWTEGFRSWSGLRSDVTIESRWRARAQGSGGSSFEP